MRRDGVELVRFPSARDPGQGPNVALFTPAAFAIKKPLGPAETWYCTVTASRDVSWMREAAASRSYEFARSAFLVDGELPAPAM
jgi:hypothetical protein